MGIDAVIVGFPDAIGAQSLLAMRESRSRTFAQDEESCVVFGMPRAA